MKVCIIGCGKMGSALLSGWLASDEGACEGITADACTICVPNAEHAAALSAQFGVRVIAAIDDAGAYDMVVLAVKPQVFGAVLPQVAAAFGGAAAGAAEGPSPLVVSIAAGIPTASIEAALPAGARVVRVMPNTPLMVGAGASVVAGGAAATAADVAQVEQLFGALGFAQVVDESQIDAVCALSGGGPAYVAALMEALTQAGAAAGLSAKLAENLVRHTVLGTCKMMAQTGQTAQETRVAVCSPGGTTLAALEAMQNSGFSESINAGIIAAQRRAKELAK